MSLLVNYQYRTTITHVNFLCSLPCEYGMYADLEHQDCPNCHESYSTNSWQFGKTVEYPVRLPCGHIYGLKCLAQMAVSKEFGHKCPQCIDSNITLLDPSYDTIRWMLSRHPCDVEVCTKINLAIHSAISVATFSRKYDGFVDWTKLFMQVYETSYVFSVDRSSLGAVAPDAPDYVFSRPLLLLEVALRTLGFFNGHCNLPNVAQLQQDSDNLRKKLKNLESRSRVQDENLPEKGCQQAIISRADSRLTIFVAAVKELRETEEKTRRMKHLQDHLWQDMWWFLWQNTKEFTICLLCLCVNLIFMAGIWTVLDVLGLNPFVSARQPVLRSAPQMINNRDRRLDIAQGKICNT